VAEEAGDREREGKQAKKKLGPAEVGLKNTVGA
jgi:hypothetical protein